MTKRRRDPSYMPPAAVEMMEASWDRESSPKVHHLVPRFYLDRWSEGGRIRVTVLDESRSYPTSPAKAARESKFYRIESDDLTDDIPPLLAESVLSEIEGLAADPLDLLASDPSAMTDEMRFHVANFLSFQIVRGVAMRRQIQHHTNSLFKLQYSELSDEGITAELLRRGQDPTDDMVASSRELLNEVRDGTITVAPQQAALVGQALSMANDLGEVLFDRRWVVYRTPRILITCDEPVLPVEGPGGDPRPITPEQLRVQRGGFGSAGVVLFPLGPDRLLAMVRHDLAYRHARDLGALAQWSPRPLTTIETTQVCREFALHAYRWTFKRPSKKVSLKLNVPVQTEREMMEDHVGGTIDDPNARVVRWFSPNRLSGQPELDPWPVDVWWAGL